jgi:hypothetical protein
MEGIPTQGWHRTTARGKKIFLPRKTKPWQYVSGLTPCALVLLREYLGRTAAPGSREMVPIMEVLSEQSLLTQISLELLKHPRASAGPTASFRET